MDKHLSDDCALAIQPSPSTGDEGQFVVEGWDLNHLDSFGLVYQNGGFYSRDDLEWNSQIYITRTFTAGVGTPFGITSWRAR